LPQFDILELEFFELLSRSEQLPSSFQAASKHWLESDLVLGRKWPFLEFSFSKDGKM